MNVVLTFNSRIAVKIKLLQKFLRQEFTMQFCRHKKSVKLSCDFCSTQESPYVALLEKTWRSDHKIGLNSNDVGQSSIWCNAVGCLRLLQALPQASRCECMIWFLNVWIITPGTADGRKIFKRNRFCTFIWQNLGVDVHHVHPQLRRPCDYRSFSQFVFFSHKDSQNW